MKSPNNSSNKSLLFRKPILAWALYDWANSAFAVTVIAGFFPVVYAALSADVSTADSFFWFNITLAASSLAVAISAPLLGAIADRGGARKKFLAAFAMLGVLMSAALAWVHAGMWQVGLLLYGVGTIGFSSANTFYDSMLLTVAKQNQFDRVSAYGYALGYLGGGVLFLVNVLMATQPQWFGFESAGAGVSAAFITVALWWGAFTVPLLLWVDETPPAQKVGTLQIIREGGAQLLRTFAELRKMKILLLFLIAYWFYIDGVNTIFKMAVFFSQRVLELPQASLITALLLTQFVSFPAALAFGVLGEKIGAKRGVLIGLTIYCAAIIYAWRWLDSGADFYLLAITIGLVQGGVQSLSRSLYARFVPPSKSAEFFGFFNMVGKFAAILGPLLLALTPLLLPFADERDSILSLLALFLIGGYLLWRVDVNKAMQLANPRSTKPPHK